MSTRLHVCGFCGSGEYNCPCRDRDELRRMIGVALIVLGLCGALAVSAHGQESGVLGARPEERQAPVWTTSSATKQKHPIEQMAAGDGLAKDAKPKASPNALTAGRAVVGPPRAPAADGEGAFARTEPAPTSPRTTARQGSAVAEAQTHHTAAEQLSSPLVLGRRGAQHQRDPLHVAQAAWLEATWNTCDAVAIAYVLKARAKRSRTSVAEMAWAYSLNKDTDRARRALTLPEGLSDREQPLWAALVKLVKRALAGKAANPAPGARHWGGMALAPDHARAMRAVREGRWYLVPAEGCANTYFGELPWAPREALSADVAAAGRRP